MFVRSFVATFLRPDDPVRAARTALLPHRALRGWMSHADASFHIWFIPRDPPDNGRSQDAADIWRLGDNADGPFGRQPACVANAATMAYDPSSRRLCAYTSIVGLPPVYLYARGGRTIVASDLYLIAGLLDGGFELDPRGVAELGRIGHPTGQRTLYKHTSRLASGATVVADETGDVVIERTWRLGPPAPIAGPQFLERQIAAFTEALRRIDVSRSFLSLTAGLDTRTVFAALAAERRLVPAATMTGVRRSLDARRAAALCRAYGVPHTLVAMDDGFTRNLPDYVQRANRLSGGVASLGQAPEVYFYEQLRGRFAARLSGNLGNQVGRGGTEGVGVRGAATDILSPAFRHAAGDESRHWLLPALDGRDSPAIEFMLQQGFPDALEGNYTVGNHFAVQQSPYADRALIETLSCRPPEGSPPSPSLVRMRWRDLRHRFLGEPASGSFQRTLVRQAGGFAATCPINFGWRATGGSSIAGSLFGAAALLGMVAERQRLDDGPAGAAVDRAGVIDFHGFQRSARWLRRHLREFACDTLGSHGLRQSGVFDGKALSLAVNDHFTRRRDRYDTITFALDVALAQRFFCAAAQSVMRPGWPSCPAA